MNAHHNIQQLFAAISVGNIRRYLTDRGWDLRPPDGNPRLFFERTFAGGEQPANVWTWSTGDHPKFRHQVPNIIFKLSVLEGRPALDIANEMYASPAEEPAAGDAATARSAGEAASLTAAEAAKLPKTPSLSRLVLRIGQDVGITIVQEMPADVVRVQAGEVVEIVHFGELNGELEMQIAEGSIQLAMPQSAQLRLLQGVARPRVGPHWSAAQIVLEESGRLEDAGDSKGAAQLIEELTPILARIDFELDINARIDPQQQAMLLRQTAVMAAALARRLPSEGPGRQLVWRACATLLFPVGLRLELRSTSIDELYDIASADEELSPKQTLAWLKENSTSVVL